MKLSDTDLAAVEHALHISMATTNLQNWPDGLLLQLLQLDQLTKLNEHMVALRKFHIGAIDKVADLLELIEKSLPTAPHVPDAPDGTRWDPATGTYVALAEDMFAPVIDPDHYA